MIKVSVIVPCYNEQARITQLLDSIHGQTFPLNEVEVIIADGLSTDATRTRIADFCSRHPELEVRVVDNNRRIIPAALNKAIEASQGVFIIRMDAHSTPDRNYIQRCVNGLEEGFGDNVGGIWKIAPGAKTWMAKAIALAVSHPLAAGDARYRIGGAAQQVDTVPFGAFHKRLISKIGPYDESLLSNEDYEFNARIRRSGGRVWLDPSIWSVYYARATLKELARQYWRYGYWKAQMLRKYPHTLRWRQILPPFFVLALIVIGLLSFVFQLARWLFAIIVIPYVIIVLGVGISMSLKQKQPLLAVGMPLAVATIHFSWGTAFLWGWLHPPSAVAGAGAP
jgi:succinoglycan biosynthesis protein ExoA